MQSLGKLLTKSELEKLDELLHSERLLERMAEQDSPVRPPVWLFSSRPVGLQKTDSKGRDL